MSIRGAMRHHVHEYPHAPGGAYEMLGRKLYEIKMSCPFMETFKKYPELWPLNLDSLRSSWERGTVGKLTIPTLGEISARCVNWSQEMDSKIQSGEMVDLDFLEDQSQLYLIDLLVHENRADNRTAVEKFNFQLEKQKILEGTPQQVSIFSQIRDAANSVLAYFDQAEAVGMLLSAKIEGLMAIIEEADADLTLMQDPGQLAIIRAMRDLWFAAYTLWGNIQSKQAPVQMYIVPMLMTINDVSTALFGDATHSVELMQLNSLDDVLAIQAGTTIHWYPPTI